MIDILATVQSAGAYAVLVVVAVEAIRKQVSFDGWRVLVVAGVVSLAVAALFLPAYSMADLLEALRLAVVAWLLAVGGDAWVSKLAVKSKTVTVLADAGFSKVEAPTRKEGRGDGH